MIRVPFVLSVTGCGWLVDPNPSLPKFRFEGTKVMVIVPVPESATVWGLFAALSVMLRVALRGPGAVGVKVTFMVQLWPPDSDVPQLSCSLKSPLLAPVKVILVIVSAVLPLLLRTVLC